jgi:hypothetical protein
MNWIERVKPSNTSEVGCLVFLVALPFFITANFLGVLDYIPRIAMGLWLIVYVFRLGFQAQAAYEVSKRTAIIVSGMLVLAYFLIWLAILVALIFGFSNFINQASSWLFFVFGMVLAVALYFHFMSFKQVVYERWLGWQPKEGIADG